MVVCAVKLCRNYTGKNIKPPEGISYYKFPTDDVLKEEWIRAMSREPYWVPGIHCRVCSVHFENSDFSVSETGRRILHKDAIPTKNLYREEREDISYSSSRRAAKRTRASMKLSVEPSADDKACRACLAVHTRMYSLTERLADTYTALTGVQVSPDDGFPQHVCRSCQRVLCEIVKFRTQCQLAISKLMQLKNDNGMITTESIASVSHENFKSNELDNMEDISDKSAKFNFVSVRNPNLLVETFGTVDIEFETNIQIKKEEYSDSSDTDNSESDINKYLELQVHEKPLQDNISKNLELDLDCGGKTLGNDENSSYIETDVTNTSTKNSINDSEIHKDKNTNKIHSCGECQKSFTRKSDLKCHLMTHSGEKPFSCDLCRKTFALNSNLRQHLRSHTGEKRYTCDVCDRKFTRKMVLINHLSNHTGNKPFSCLVCKKTFALQSLLDIHSLTHSRDKPFSCDICQKAFTQKSNLTQHQLLHTGEKPHSCHVCKKRFTQKHHLNEHMRSHTGEKPFSCELCHRNFSQRNNLTQHLKTHTGEKGYSCHLCHKYFSRKNNLNSHLLLHTGEKPFSCDVCQKTFRQKSNLTQHQLTHTGEKKYTCEICLKNFARQADLKCHHAIHSGEKPYSCDVCHKTFAQKGKLTQHVRSHAGTK